MRRLASSVVVVASPPKKHHQHRKIGTPFRREDGRTGAASQLLLSPERVRNLTPLCITTEALDGRTEAKSEDESAKSSRSRTASQSSSSPNKICGGRTEEAEEANPSSSSSSHHQEKREHRRRHLPTAHGGRPRMHHHHHKFALRFVVRTDGCGSRKKAGTGKFHRKRRGGAMDDERSFIANVAARGRPDDKRMWREK